MDNLSDLPPHIITPLDHRLYSKAERFRQIQELRLAGKLDEPIWKPKYDVCGSDEEPDLHNVEADTIDTNTSTSSKLATGCSPTFDYMPSATRSIPVRRKRGLSQAPTAGVQGSGFAARTSGTDTDTKTSACQSWRQADAGGFGSDGPTYAWSRLPKEGLNEPKFPTQGRGAWL